MKYYDLKRNWTKKIEPHLQDEEVQQTLVREMNKFTMGLRGTPFLHGMLPKDVDAGDWLEGRRGPYPRYFQYVKMRACHWVANFALRLAQKAEPSRPWRIVTSDEHTTVWDGGELLFDINYQAFGIDPDEAWRAANENGRHLPVGQLRPTGYPEPWWESREEREKKKAVKGDGGMVVEMLVRVKVAETGPRDRHSEERMEGEAAAAVRGRLEGDRAFELLGVGHLDYDDCRWVLELGVPLDCGLDFPARVWPDGSWSYPYLDRIAGNGGPAADSTSGRDFASLAAFVRTTLAEEEELNRAQASG